MKTIEQLLERRHNARIGNHRVIFVKDFTERHFVYYQTIICVAEDNKERFMLDNGGYDTPSTKRALLAYRREFHILGYTEQLELKIVGKKRDGSFKAMDQIGAIWILDQEDFPDHKLAKGLKVIAQAQYEEIDTLHMILEEPKEVSVG